MKSKIVFSLTAFILIFGCSKDLNNHNFYPRIDGLSLYWDHTVFGKEGRRIRFEFYGTNQFEDSYNLLFKYSINQNNITISLTDMVDQGKCPRIDPGWGNDTLCAPRGDFFIPDSLIKNGTYSLTLKTSGFSVTSKLTVNNDSISLNIPPNKNFFCSIHSIFPLPKDLLFGYIVFYGSENNESAQSLLTGFLALGLTKTHIPDYHYYDLLVDSNGTASDSSWPPDYHSVGFLYSMDAINFKDIVNLALGYINNSDLDISLYTSNGDQAFLNKEGINIVYANY
jgi:hypothetical protein